MLQGKKILLGISGSIAAYKTPELVRQFVKTGAEVRVVMTPSAQHFVSPLSLSTVSKYPVVFETATDHHWNNHVELGRWADLFVIAPLSCNTLAKLAFGLCDNMLLACYLSATCPVVVAPAMDSDMWMHPTTQRNLATLMEHGVYQLPVGEGELASGLIGPGRMAEPHAIVDWANRFFHDAASPSLWESKSVLITAGPTYEPIDPVRFIGNRSSGKMGLALAAELVRRGAQVHVVLGPSSEAIPTGLASLTRVETAADMYEAAIQRFASVDVAILSAAVADYRPVDVAAEKIKKASGGLPQIILQETADILHALGNMKRDNQCLVGFALETQQEEENALAKLTKKNADYIVLNSLRDAGAGFGVPTNKISIFDRAGTKKEFPLASKEAVATFILDHITL